jgi:signal transduction histidine kinase
MMRRSSLLPRTLRGRLALWYGAALTVVLLVFSVVVYDVAVVEPDTEEDQDPKAEAEQALAQKRMLIALAICLPTALVVAVGGGTLLSRRELLPLEQIIAVSERLGAQSLALRLTDDSRRCTEVRRLVESLNRMLERIEQSVTGLRRFTADASHELRTPLALVMGNLELALRRRDDPVVLAGALECALEELGRMTSLIEALLTFARSDAGELPMTISPTELCPVIDSVVESYRAVAVEQGVSLTAECEAGIVVRADALWLSRALANLVDNACKFSPRSGAVAIVVRGAGRRVEIDVVDQGPGITPSDRAQLFQRFFRSEAVRGSIQGSGLGLSLAREIARAFGGDLELVDTAAGATLRLAVVRC